MNKEPLILLSLIGLVGYGVFHGHRFGKDCFLCPYRGLIFMGSSVVLGGFLAYSEN
jgi:hypothetical protein